MTAAPRPPAPPWGALITAARQDRGLSARKAARLASISEGMWRQITAGWQAVEPGVTIPVHGTPATLARMAAAVGLTPAQLSSAGRPDAARVLRSMQVAPTADAVLADLDARITTMPPDEAKRLLCMIGERINAEQGRPPRRARDRDDSRRYGTTG
jgi:Helix-turn-helix domain